jgi:hypothetical protein
MLSQFCQSHFKGIFIVTFYIEFVSGKNSRVGWTAAVVAAAAGSGAKPKNVKSEFATVLRLCQQSSQDS